jgi:hypothetical protein
METPITAIGVHILMFFIDRLLNELLCSGANSSWSQIVLAPQAPHLE